MTDLLPCPFCGSNNLRYEFCGSQGYIECNECGTQGPCDERAADPICDLDAACDAWNRRAALAQPEPLTDKGVAELVAALKNDAECVEVEHYDLCSMTAEQMRRAADLLERLAQPEPQGPTDEELMAAYWEAFKNAAPCGADQSWLAGLRAVALWDRSVIEPDGPAVLGSREPASVTDQPTDEELDEFAIYWWWTEIDERSVSDVIESGSMAAFARAVLARWGRPAIEPVPGVEGEQ